MCPEDEVLDSEFLIFRIPPEPDMTAPRIGGGERASSYALDPGEKLKRSCSRASKTSPFELLQLNARDYDNWREWFIGAIRVRDVNSKGFEIEICPKDEDPGHCNFVLPNAENLERSPRKARWGKLAKCTRVLEPDEIESGDIRDF